MAQVLTHTADDITSRIFATLRLLRTTAEAAYISAVSSGCLLIPAQRKIDTFSLSFAVHYFSGKPTEQFLRALHDTGSKLSSLRALLRTLICDGSRANNRIWMRHGATHYGAPTRNSILCGDLAWVTDCIDMVNRRIHMEYRGHILEPIEINLFHQHLPPTPYPSTSLTLPISP